MLGMQDFVWLHALRTRFVYSLSPDSELEEGYFYRNERKVDAKKMQS
jgi:hypothetical protein